MQDADLSSVSDVALVQTLQQALLDEDVVDLTAEFFKALSDPTRIRIVNAL